MAKTFFPTKSISIPASKPHPDHTEYKISVGTEIWNKKNHVVVKIQMVYDKKIAGRRSPSFPLDTDDFQRVSKEIDKLLSK